MAEKTRSKDRAYKIEITPEILELLGPSLYTNIYFVLAELVANAYDANAHNVFIVARDNQIIVEDDGNGMSYEDGIQHYLKVAKESRKTNDDIYVIGSQRTRRRLGEKV